MVVWRGVIMVVVGCFSKDSVKLIQIVCQLLILQSAGGWCLVTGDITLQAKTGCPLKLSRVELVSTWMEDLLGN